MKTPIFELDLKRNLWDRAFLILLIISLALRLLFLATPPITQNQGMIFDEVYYVNAVRNILGLPLSTDQYGNQRIFVGAQPHTDPNLEHPPLAKAIVAVFVALIGDNSWGYRLPSVLFGMITLLYFYLTVKKLGGNAKIAFFASFFFAFDVLTFIHTRIFTLDIFLVGFMITGFYYYLKGNLTIAGTLLALSTLCKIGGIYGVVAIGLYHLFSKLKIKKLPSGNISIIGKKAIYRFIERFGIGYVVTLLVLWELLDLAIVKLPQPGGWYTANVFQHMFWLFNYTVNLRVGGYTLIGEVINIKGELEPNSIASPPWLWLINQRAIPYLLAAVDYYTNGKLVKTVPTLQFWGVVNPALIVIMLPAVVQALWSFLKSRDKASLFGLIWWGATYLVWYGMALMNRVLYLFYIIQAVGSICLLSALMLNTKRFSTILYVSFTLIVLAGFIYYFPYKTIP